MEIYAGRHEESWRGGARGWMGVGVRVGWGGGGGVEDGKDSSSLFFS